MRCRWNEFCRTVSALGLALALSGVGPGFSAEAPAVKAVDSRWQIIPSDQHDLTVEFEGKSWGVRWSATTEAGTAVLHESLMPTSLSLRQGEQSLRPLVGEDPFSKVLLNDSQPVVLEMSARNLLDESKSCDALLKAAEARLGIGNVFRAQPNPKIEAVLEGYGSTGKTVALATTSVFRSKDSKATIRWEIPAESLSQFKKLKRSDLRATLTVVVSGVRFDTQGRVLAEAESKYIARFEHLINLVPGDVRVIDIEIGENGTIKTTNEGWLTSVLKVRRISPVGENSAFADKWFEKALDLVHTGSEKKQATASDLVVFTFKDHVVWVSLNRIDTLTKDELKTYKLQTKDFKRTHDTEESKKSGSYLGISASKESKESHLSEVESQKLLETLRHLKQELSGKFETLPTFSLNQMKSLVTHMRDIVDLRNDAARQESAKVETDIGLAEIPWAEAQLQIHPGFRITRNPPSVALVTVDRDGKITLTGPLGETSVVSPGKDGKFQAFSRDARYREDGSIEWYAQGYDTAVTDVWQSCNVAGACATFHNRGDGSQKCFVSLNTDGGLVLKRENGELTTTRFDPQDPLRGTAWGTGFTVQNGRVIRWDGGYWTYHAYREFPPSPNYPEAKRDLEVWWLRK